MKSVSMIAWRKASAIPPSVLIYTKLGSNPPIRLVRNLNLTQGLNPRTRRSPLPTSISRRITSLLIRIPALKQILVWMPTIAREMKFASTKVLTMVLSKVTANLLSVQTS
jgi:hypothetical protein